MGRTGTGVDLLPQGQTRRLGLVPHLPLRLLPPVSVLLRLPVPGRTHDHHQHPLADHDLVSLLILFDVPRPHPHPHSGWVSGLGSGREMVVGKERPKGLIFSRKPRLVPVDSCRPGTFFVRPGPRPRATHPSETPSLFRQKRCQDLTGSCHLDDGGNLSQSRRAIPRGTD